jgi:hypothetical protein
VTRDAATAAWDEELGDEKISEKVTSSTSNNIGDVEA